MPAVRERHRGVPGVELGARERDIGFDALVLGPRISLELAHQGLGFGQAGSDQRLASGHSSSARDS